ncbi:MAG: hypothetical protein JWM18_909 [Chloroflexi bacterium]|jgi:hypothetical protein|nr:hypothetical protein [Chloroflexota bacterium]
MSATVPVHVIATVRQYIPDAIHDHFDDGSFASYDATQLAVVEPERLRPEALTIHHSEKPTPDSPWRQVGRRLSFTIPRDLLRPDTVLFDGSVQDLHVLP